MKKTYLFALCVLTAAVAVGTLAEEKPPKEQAPGSVLIVPEGTHSREGIGQFTAISVVDRKTIEKLEAFFPKYRTYPSADLAGGWEAGHRVYFNFGKGRSIRVTVSENGGGDTWTVGDGDFATRGDFPKFVKELQRRTTR